MLQPTTVAETLPILVPVDFSTASDEALLFAAQLAACSSQPLVIVHIVHDDIHKPDSYPRKTEAEQMLPMEEIAQAALQDFMARMREQQPDSAVLMDAEVMLVSGLPATRILEIARQIGAGLIVMGSNGRTSLSKLIRGSVSGKVIRRSPVSVTVVRSNRATWEHCQVLGRQAGGAESFRGSEEPV